MVATAHEHALVTGASSGIGFELTRCAAERGCDLLIVADHAEIETAREELARGVRQVPALRHQYYRHRADARAHARLGQAVSHSP